MMLCCWVWAGVSICWLVVIGADAEFSAELRAEVRAEFANSNRGAAIFLFIYLFYFFIKYSTICSKATEPPALKIGNSKF